MNEIKRAGRQETTPYGIELILDLHGCDPATFTRSSLDEFLTKLCQVIEMEKCQVHFWDDIDVSTEEQQTLPHTKGTSAVCFILTSTIVVHTLDLLRVVYVNIFSCKAFNPDVAQKFTEEWFAGTSRRTNFIERV
ncbi:MAG: S-adenosylmethionine decarboxylase [Verrucomicrobia bacterium]|nr:S-adenosylmethionine decarboxylase [Verrucomicrobiota bacterium]